MKAQLWGKIGAAWGGGSELFESDGGEGGATAYGEEGGLRIECGGEDLSGIE